jgi:uracil-DNA glycosylase
LRRDPLLQRHVPARFPARGPVYALVYGEAPGPRGADRSGIPFWGDRSGRLVYRALSEAQLAHVPARAWEVWNGAELARLHITPRLSGAALSNALPFCPSRDGHTFCAPTRRELDTPENRARVLDELERAQRRCPGTLSVIALGRHAEWLLEKVSRDAPGLALYPLPHPSAQALASARSGGTLREREDAWVRALVRLLDEAKS